MKRKLDFPDSKIVSLPRSISASEFLFRKEYDSVYGGLKGYYGNNHRYDLDLHNLSQAVQTGFMGELVKHYLGASGRDFYIDDHPEALKVVEKFDITEGQIWKELKTPYTYVNNILNTKPLFDKIDGYPKDNLVHQGDFLTEMSKVYQFFLNKEKKRKKGEPSYFPKRFFTVVDIFKGGKSPSTDSDPRLFTLEQSEQLNYYFGLGSYRVYFYGKMRIEKDGRWSFEGNKIIYDYWNWDIKWSELNNRRNWATLLGKNYLNRINSNIDKDYKLKPEPFQVILSSPMAYGKFKSQNKKL